MTSFSHVAPLAATEQNTTLVVLWGAATAAGCIGVLLGLVVVAMRWGKQEGMSLEVGVIKAGNLSLGLFIVVLGAATAIPAFDTLTTELGKDPPSRCSKTGVKGEVDGPGDSRQPIEGTACVNGDEVATFFDGELRVAVKGIRDRRIGSAVLETSGDETPIHTACPFVWTPGLGAGHTMRLRYTPAPEDARKEDVIEWVLHIESVSKDNARVFAERSASRYAGQALRDLQRRGTKGRPVIACESTAPGLQEYPGSDFWRRRLGTR